MSNTRSIVSNKSYRELLETKNVFADPAYCREAWKSVGTAILLSPAIGCVGDIDTREGSIEAYTYDKLCRELKEIDGNGKGRQPTELEMIFHCQAARARFDTSAAVFVRDTVGAKPVDESKVTVGKSQYEEMSDDELEALLKYRESKRVTYTVDTYTVDTDTVEPTPAEDDPTATIGSTGETIVAADVPTSTIGNGEANAPTDPTGETDDSSEVIDT